MPTRPRPASPLAPRLALAGARAWLALTDARARLAPPSARARLAPLGARSRLAPPGLRAPWLALAGALALCAGPRAARADEAAAGGGQARNDWHLEAGVGTDFPVQLGARVGLEAPGRLRASTSLGVLPGPYVDAINGVLVGVDAYSRAEADLVSNTLGSSLVWRTHVGWRPFADAGFYADAGYALVTLGGGGTAAELVAGLAGRKLPPGAGRIDVEADSTLHMLDVELGWRFPLGPSFAAWTALGGAFTVASSTTLTPDETGQPLVDAEARSIADAGAKRLDEIYTSYVFTPVLSLGLAYVFF